MYQLISGVSFIIRAYLCYKTIESVPILANPFANSILWEVIPFYTVLMAISRNIVSLFYSKGEAPTLGAIAYFFVYLVVLGITYIVMLLLTKFCILPI